MDIDSEEKNNTNHKKEKSPSALTSGIVAIMALMLPALGFRLSIITHGLFFMVCLGFGIRGLILIRNKPEMYTGKGFALFGIGYSVFILVIVALVLLGIIN